MSTSTQNYSYDEVPYKSYPYRQTHPERLATMAVLMGLTPTPIQRARILEIGCASGGNIIPMADLLPESEFVGVDLSQRAIQDGKQLAEEIGLKNITLRQANLKDIGPDWGEFDYIVSHGVYSWIPDDAQHALMRVCAERLSPHGVAYISYNTYPGWHMRGMIRDMMCYRARAFNSPSDRIRHARALIDFLSQAVPAEDNAYGILLKNELNLLREKDDSYLLHEHLEDVNAPVYFYQFVERAESHGLQYLAEADFRVMAISNFPKEISAILQSVSSNAMEIEQYMDFVRNRMFRQTLLCRQGLNIERSVTLDRVFSMHIASPARPEQPATDVPNSESITFRGPSSVLTTAEPLVKAAMLKLAEAWPASIPFSQLYAASRSRLRKEPLFADASMPTDDARKLAEAIVRGYATSLVEVSVSPPSFVTEVSARPEVSALCRLQAQRGNMLTNRRHEMVRINDLQRHMVQMLIGNLSLNELLDKLVGMVEQGRLMIHEQGDAIRDTVRARSILERSLEPNLRHLAIQCLLTG